MDLAAFLASEAARPAEPGFCCRFVDRWVRVRRGVSPMALCGRTCCSETDVAAWIGAEGGLHRAVCRAMRAAGIARTRAPQDGDAGLIVPEDGAAMAMALRTGGFWVMAAAHGGIAALGSVDRVCAAWRIG